MPTFGMPSPMPHVPRCCTLKLVAQRQRKLEEKSLFPEQPSPTPAKHHCAQPLSKVTHLIIAHFDCRCRVCANARYGATNACKSQGLLNCLATGFVAYGAGVDRQGPLGLEQDNLGWSGVLREAMLEGLSNCKKFFGCCPKLRTLLCTPSPYHPDVLRGAESSAS